MISYGRAAGAAPWRAGRADRTDMLVVSTPRRSRYLVAYAYVLDGGTVLKRFVGLRKRAIASRAERCRAALAAGPHGQSRRR